MAVMQRVCHGLAKQTRERMRSRQQMALDTERSDEALECPILL